MYLKKENAIKKKKTPYTSKQPLMMAYEVSESARDNFVKFIYQFQLKQVKIKTNQIICKYLDDLTLNKLQ